MAGIERIDGSSRKILHHNEVRGPDGALHVREQGVIT